jgi:hypothetical protein
MPDQAWTTGLAEAIAAIRAEPTAPVVLQPPRSVRGIAGTGYLTTAGTVLTAWHVVGAAGAGGLVAPTP